MDGPVSNRTTNAAAEILLTGATGFLGKVVLHELVRRADVLGIARIHLLIRRNRRSAPDARWRAEIAASPCFAALPGDWRERICVVGGELTEPHAGIPGDARAALAQRLTHVIHCAASVQFDLPLADAARANITSALEVLELARACPHLASLVCVSTAYVTQHPGDEAIVEERLAPLPQPARDLYAAILRGSADEAALLAESGHPNTYTLTKCMAEHLMTERAGNVPLSFVRPSIISASLRQPCPGWIDSPAAFALFIMSIASGRMRAVIANPNTRLDVVPVDCVAERVVAAAFAAEQPAPGAPSIRHAVTGYERSPTLAQCRRVIEQYFRRNPIADARGRDAAARVRYLGRDGLRYRLRHWLHHSRRPDAHLVAGRLEQTNRVFSYFTQNTFRFRSSVPLEDPGFEPRAYVETVCRGVARNLMDGDESAVSFAGRRHAAPRSDLRWAWSQPRGSAWLRLAAVAVRKTLRRCAERVTFDLGSFEAALAQLPPGASLVIVPSHRSYLDFVLVPYLAFARPDLGLDLPCVAAASDYARIPLLGWLFPRLNAFYVERGPRRREKELTAQVHALIRAGHALELFIESHRSRDRRFLPARRGMLRSLQATGETVALLPLTISYERIPEERGFLAELRGAQPAPHRLRDLLAWSLRVVRGEVSLGRIHLAFGNVVPLDLRSDVHAVGRAVLQQLASRVATTSQALSAFLEAERPALDGIDLRWLERAIEARGGRVLDSGAALGPLPALVERCLRHQFEHFFYPEAARCFAGNPALTWLARAHEAGPARDAAAEMRSTDERLQRLLRALFAPVCREFAATARALGTPDAPPRIATAREVLGAGRDVLLTHAEAALDDLLRRKILTRADGGFTWGPRALEIDAYRAACARGIAYTRAREARA